MELFGIILKSGMPTASPNPRERIQAGAFIRVNREEYDRLVPRHAHEAKEYLAADKARKEAYEKTSEGKEAVKLFKALQRERHRNALRVLAAREEAAKVAKLKAVADTKRRLAAIEKREADAVAAEKRAKDAAKKAADPGDGNK